MLPNSFYKASIILIAKPDKDTTHTKTSKSVALMNIDAKMFQKIVVSQIQQYLQGSHTMIKWDFSQRCKDDTTSTNESIYTPH